MLGWTSPILYDVDSDHGYIILINGTKIDSNQIGWMGSFATLGGMFMCIPTGFICDLIGRKKTLLSLVIPFTVGWLLIIFANNIWMIYFGRLITGLASGACCVAAPLYTSEIAHKSLRGTLGSYFQLMVTTGIFLSYLIGKYLNAFWFTIWSASMPVVFVLIFVFQPESPTYLVKINLHEAAKQVLRQLRGPHYNVEAELVEIEGSLKGTTHTAVSWKETLKQKHVQKAFLISTMLMTLQQFSGINVIILYTTSILKASSGNWDPRTATILVGAVQVIATFASSLVVDKLGRRILLLISSLFISVSTFLLAVYFSISQKGEINDVLVFLPVVALSIFMIAYSLGLGPLPWVMSSEIFPIEIKSISTSVAGTVNWLLAFILTKFYFEIAQVIQKDGVFYLFSIVSLHGLFFIYFLVPETKGKTFTEIEMELRNWQMIVVFMLKLKYCYIDIYWCIIWLVNLKRDNDIKHIISALNYSGLQKKEHIGIIKNLLTFKRVIKITQRYMSLTLVVCC